MENLAKSFDETTFYQRDNIRKAYLAGMRRERYVRNQHRLAVMRKVGLLRRLPTDFQKD